MRLAVPALLLVVLTSCTSFHDKIPIHFSSEPPGADVLIDGVPTGMATPCMLALPKEEQRVSLRKPGYQIAIRELFPDPYTDTWFWKEATVGPHTYDFPLFINLDDAITPVKRRNELIPARIFVRLKRLADQ